MNEKKLRDIWGNEVSRDPLLRDKFIEPPFSVLDTKTGSWQKRKRLWLEKGIKSEIGRADDLLYSSSSIRGFDYYRVVDGKKRESKEQATSIFDPALAELMYRWFCPDGGTILDPFAGGSVRGIVAHHLGYKYTGIELRKEQIDANKENAFEILATDNQPIWHCGDSEFILDDLTVGVDTKIKISVRSLLQKFHPCEVGYIQTVCHGRCCEGSGGLMVTIHNSEVDRIKSLGGIVENVFLKDTNGGKCQFKVDDLCSIHNEKPFGCKASPFTLTVNNVLIVRNRYRLLRCYDKDDGVPAYQAHRWSLEQIFGIEETRHIISEIENGVVDIFAVIDKNKMQLLVDNDKAKHPERKNNGFFDFIFSCPPYMDLEVYSDDKSDLSNMSDVQFIEKYNSIIHKACSKLKVGSFACFVVGDVRDKKTGFYKDFIGITKRAFYTAGMCLYNEMILLNVIGTASMKADRTFGSNKKVIKIHQNVLIFKK